MKANPRQENGRRSALRTACHNFRATNTPAHHVLQSCSSINISYDPPRGETTQIPRSVFTTFHLQSRRAAGSREQRSLSLPEQVLHPSEQTFSNAKKKYPITLMREPSAVCSTMSSSTAAARSHALGLHLPHSWARGELVCRPHHWCCHAPPAGRGPCWTRARSRTPQHPRKPRPAPSRDIEDLGRLMRCLKLQPHAQLCQRAMPPFQVRCTHVYYDMASDV